MKSKDWYLADLETETELQDMDYSRALSDCVDCIKMLERLSTFEHDTIVASYAQESLWRIKSALKELTPHA